MKFKDFFNNNIIKELSEYNYDRIPTNVKRLLEHKKLPFNHIFGDKLRIAERLAKTSDYKAKISAHISDFEIDFEKWAGFKLTDQDKKNPFRIGKLLNKRQQELKKFITPLLQKDELTPAEQANLQHWQNADKELSELLKVSDLQKLYKDSQQSDYYIVYSRSPVDVARMSDHTWSSCHSQGGQYFHCALADATSNAGIAYLIRAADFPQIELHLQTDEIFKDKERSINGIIPVGRYRIRCAMDSKGNTLAVPSLKLYGKDVNSLGPDFANQVTNWAKRQDISNFDFDNVLTLKGGTYEDGGYDLSSMIKRIWGKDIEDYDTDDSEDEYEDQNQEEDDHAEEQWRDEQRDGYDAEDIYIDALGREYDDLFEVSYDINNGVIELAYKIPGKVIKQLKAKIKDIDIKKSYDLEFFNPSKKKYTASISFLTETLNFDIEDNVDFYDYVEYYGDGDGRFRDSLLTQDVSNILQTRVASFLGEPYNTDEGDEMFELRQMMNSKIYEFFQVEYKKLDTDQLKDFYDRYIAGESTGDKRNFGKFEIPTFEYEVEKLAGSVWGRGINISDQVFDILQEVSEDIEERLGLYISSKFNLPITGHNYSIWDAFHSYMSVPAVFTGEVEAKKDYKRLKFRSSTSKRLYTLNIWLTQADAEIILDSGGLVDYYNAMLYLDEELAGGIDDKNLNFFELHDFVKPLAPSKEYEDLAKQGQMELDLAHVVNFNVNKNMSHFDDAIEQILKESYDKDIISELNMGRGGMANQSGSQATPPVQQGQQQQSPQGQNGAPPNTAQPQSGGAQNAQQIASPTNNPQQTSNQTPAGTPDELQEFDTLLKTQQQNPEEFNRQARVLANDPAKFSRFMTHLIQPLKQ